MPDAPIDSDVHDLYRRGGELLASRNPHQAVTVLERASALVPGSESIDVLLGRAYFATGRWEAAEAVFARTVERHPTNDYAHFGLALTLLKRGRAVEAVGHLRLAMAMRPGSPSYARALARATAAARRTADAGRAAPGPDAPGEDGDTDG